MNSIIVTDVFGITSALKSLGEAINADMIVDPYEGKIMGFENEAQAYHYFTENIGLDAYVDKLSETIKECIGEVALIGFSVGSSAIWQLSASTSVNIIETVKHATCFYGSQIRHSHELSPNFEVKLIFPRYESHFDVSELQWVLTQKSKVTAVKVDFLHGFMNFHSTNYDQMGYEEHIVLLLNDELFSTTEKGGY